MNQTPSQSPRIRRWQAWTFLIAFALLLGGLIGGNLLAWQAGKFEQTAENGWQAFMRGAPMAALADDLRNTDFVARLGRLQREAGWLLLRDTGPRVRTGCPGWLFLVDELTVHPHRLDNAKVRVELVTRVHEQLAREGNQLLVAVVPDKSRVEAAQRCDIPRSPAFEDRLAIWSQRLATAGVSVVDTTAALAEQRASTGRAFDRSDTHWNLDGARAAAQAVAEAMSRLGFTPANPILLTPEYGPPEPRWGDLVRLAGLDKLPERWRPRPDLVPEVQFTASAAKPAALDAAALFGDSENQPVALVGTSYSRNAHFADFLVEALQSEVGNLARDGGGFARAMNDFLDGQSAGHGGWVIWEIPERVLEAPIGAEEAALAARLKRITP